MEKLELRKVRDFSAKINATFEFTRGNFKALGKNLLLIGGPAFLIQGVFTGFYSRQALQLTAAGAGTFSMEWLSGVVFWLGMMLLSSLVAYLLSMATVFEYMKLYEEKPAGAPIGVGEVWGRAKVHIIPLLAAGVATSFLVLIALLFLLIPGIYLSVVFVLIAPIIVFEKKTFGDAFGRSFKLISNKWWSTFGLIVIVSLIVSFMGVVFAVPQMLFTFLATFHSMSNTGTQLPVWQEIGLMATTILQTVGGSLLQGILFIALAFQYLNLVERKEGKGLMDRISQFGQAPQAQSRADETY